jgi:uracil-DNA glycosylase
MNSDFDHKKFLKNPASSYFSKGVLLIDSYHCSRYNTQTKRLTAPMFEQVFERARVLVDQ